MSHASASASSCAPSGIASAARRGRVAGAVPALVVVADPVALLGVEHAGGEAGAEARVLAHVLELRAGERAGAREQLVGERGLADVVQARRAWCRRAWRAGSQPSASASATASSATRAPCVAARRSSRQRVERRRRAPRAMRPRGPRRPDERGVAAERLRPVQRLVGARQQALGVAGGAQVADPHRRGDRQAARERGLVDRRAQALGGDQRALGGVVGQQPGELLAADPPDGVDRARRAGDPPPPPRRARGRRSDGRGRR